MLVQILNPLDPAAEPEQRRIWLDAGTPAIVGPGKTLTLFQDWGDGEPQPYLLLATEKGSVRMPLEHGTYYNCVDYRVNPVAIEYAEGNRHPARILLQFVRTSSGVRWAS